MVSLAAGYLSPGLGQWLAEGPSMKQPWSDRDCFARQPRGHPFAGSRSRGGWVEFRGSVPMVLSLPVLGPLHSESFLSLFQPFQSSSARERGCLRRESCRKARGKGKRRNNGSSQEVEICTRRVRTCVETSWTNHDIAVKCQSGDTQKRST